VETSRSVPGIGPVISSVHNFLGLCDENGDIATASLLENWIK